MRRKKENYRSRKSRKKALHINQHRSQKTSDQAMSDLLEIHRMMSNPFAMAAAISRFASRGG